MSFDLSMLVVDPRKVASDVKTPIVAWEGQQRTGTETWEGKISKRTTTPQVELRRLLDNGGTAVIRLNIGNHATNTKGKEVSTGIIMSSNKSVNMNWDEYYALREAIDEGVTKLVAEHANVYEEIAKKAQDKADKAAKAAKVAEAAPVSPVGEGDPDFDDTPGDDEAPA